MATEEEEQQQQHIQHQKLYIRVADDGIMVPPQAPPKVPKTSEVLETSPKLTHATGRGWWQRRSLQIRRPLQGEHGVQDLVEMISLFLSALRGAPPTPTHRD